MPLMQLVGVRSTDPDDGLVAVLVEDGGPAMLAIPVTAHEGLVLQAHGSHRSPSWPRLLDDLVEALGGRIGRTELDVDDDARIVARLIVETPACASQVMTVACTPGEGLLLSGYHRFPVHASSSLTRLRAVDLSDDTAWSGLRSGSACCRRLMVWPTTRGTDVTRVTDVVICGTFYHCCVVGARLHRRQLSALRR